MGNRAVITTRHNFDNDGVGIYLHWNGGRDSVEAFLKYCELKGHRAPSDDCYGWARLAQVIGNFFGGSLSVGFDKVSNLDCNNGDNGTYIIEGWEIVGREYFRGSEQQEYDLDSMVRRIDSLQPAEEQLGEFLSTEEIDTVDLKIGDIVFTQDFRGKVELYNVIGFGDDRYVNGTNVFQKPYVNHFAKDGTYEDNINNYIRTETVRVKR